jgi:hypothetical protein
MKNINDLRITTSNVLSLYRSGAYRSFCDIMKNNTAAVQEVRCVGNRVLESKECTFYCSCHTEKHIFGAGFIVGKRIGHMILAFRPIRMHMCKLWLRGKFNNYSFICVHANMEDKDGEEKEKLYDELEKAYHECPRSDVKLILGDFYAKVACEYENENIGKYDLHTECNDSDRRLVAFATSHGMMVGRILFPRKNIYKVI